MYMCCMAPLPTGVRIGRLPPLAGRTRRPNEATRLPWVASRKTDEGILVVEWGCSRGCIPATHHFGLDFA